MTVSDWYLTAIEIVGDYGTLSREQCATLGIHEDDPQPGYYRVPPPKRALREADDLDEVYVRIWSDGDTCRAEWQGSPMDACAAWTWCARYPISEDRYYRAARHGFTNLGAFAPGNAALRGIVQVEM